MSEILLLLIYSGAGWFAGGVIVVVLLALDLGSLFTRHRILGSAARILVTLAVVVMAMTSTPLPPPLAVMLVASLLAALALSGSRFIRWRKIAASAAITAVLAALMVEAPRMFASPPEIAPPSHLVVLGDSLLSGGFGESQRWADHLGGTLITDLARPSETSRSALERIDEITAALLPGVDLLIALGGNDMLEDRSAADYAANLDAVLSAVPADSRIFMIEFPVLPARWRWIVRQRQLAGRHDAVLIPRRVMAKVLANPANTSDGLHLTDRGHRELARLLAPWLGFAVRKDRDE
ncbi:MAG TPA: GDSL-type esterase/lipase family protein [Thermoanaerobaculia bacterium]|nr:GDSL-type esterase/lipase family protein [Thermoanaerobaculia bacterium]